MTETTHWAAELIGLPYRRGAHGPDEFDCWGLVRHVFAQVHGVPMPPIEVGQADDTAHNVAAIKRAATVSGWRPSESPLPADGDIVLMDGIEGRHVGVMIAANGGLLLLHCIERVGVCLQPLPDLQRAGFRNFAFWRRA